MADIVISVLNFVLSSLLQRVNSKDLPHYTGYLRKALKTVSVNLIGDELHGFALKVT